MSPSGTPSLPQEWQEKKSMCFLSYFSFKEQLLNSLSWPKLLFFILLLHISTCFSATFACLVTAFQRLKQKMCTGAWKWLQAYLNASRWDILTSYTNHILLMCNVKYLETSCVMCNVLYCTKIQCQTVLFVYSPFTQSDSWRVNELFINLSMWCFVQKRMVMSHRNWNSRCII